MGHFMAGRLGDSIVASHGNISSQHLNTTPHRKIGRQIGNDAIFGLELIEKLGELRIRGIFVFADALFLEFLANLRRGGREGGDLLENFEDRHACSG
jgi:hypothetical protein